MSLAYLTATATGVEIAIHAQPRASRSRLVGEHDGRLKVQLAAPPVDGEANDALVELIARVLGVARRQVALAAGQSGRRKLVRVEGVGLDQAAEAIRKALA
jgi:uncharacterized protein (TIGR00251 family)